MEGRDVNFRTFFYSANTLFPVYWCWRRNENLRTLSERRNENCGRLCVYFGTMKLLHWPNLSEKPKQVVSVRQVLIRFWGLLSESNFIHVSFKAFRRRSVHVHRKGGSSRTEMSSETIAGHGDPIDGFAPGQPCAGTRHLSFLVTAGSAAARDGIEILRTVRLALLGLFLHFLFQFTKVAKNNPEPIRITHGLVFFKNLNSLLIAVFQCCFLQISILFLSPEKYLHLSVVLNFFVWFFSQKTCTST